MTKLILILALHWHIAVLPLFVPKINGVHNGDISVSDAPAWNNILNTGQLEQPEGAIVVYKENF